LFIPRLPDDQDNNYQGLARAMAGEYDAYSKRVRRMIEPLKPALHPGFADDVLISSEHLSSGKFRPFLSAFAKYIDAMGFRKIAVLVIRDQISWLNSRIAQKRKMIHETDLPFKGQIETMMSEGEGDWQNLCQTLVTCGFELFVRPNNKSYNERGAVHSIFATPPIKPYASLVKIPEPKIFNKSFGAKQQILADLVRDYVAGTLGLPTFKIDRHALRKIIADEFSGRMDDMTYNGFDPEFRDKVTEHYKAGNEWVAKTYFNKNWADIFPKETLAERSPQVFTALSPQDQQRLRRLAENVIDRATREGVFGAKSVR